MKNDNMENVYALLDEFIEKSKKLVCKHPYLVIIAMHEYFRNILYGEYLGIFCIMNRDPRMGDLVGYDFRTKN